MYAVRLPGPIPPAGSPQGPPLAAARHIFLHMPQDIRVLDRELAEHPERIQQALDDMMAAWRKMLEEKRPKPGR